MFMDTQLSTTKQEKKSQTKAENYTLICKLAKKIFSEWEGKVVEEENKCITLFSNNDICGKRVECKVSIELLNSEQYPFAVSAQEKTCCILGGCGMPCKDLQEVEQDALNCLKRFMFRQKEQISLFYFEWVD